MRRATDLAQVGRASIGSRLRATVAFSAPGVHLPFSRTAAIVGRTARGSRLVRQAYLLNKAKLYRGDKGSN